LTIDSVSPVLVTGEPGQFQVSISAQVTPNRFLYLQSIIWDVRNAQGVVVGQEDEETNEQIDGTQTLQGNVYLPIDLPAGMYTVSLAITLQDPSASPVSLDPAATFTFNPPTPTATQVPAATSTPVPATAVPAPATSMPVPTATPYPTYTPYPSPTPVPATATATPRIVASKGRHPPAPLVVSVLKRTVPSGGYLTLHLTAAPHAHLTITVEVGATRLVTIGKGHNKRRVRRSITLYRVSQQGIADSRGRFTARLHVTYPLQSKRPGHATLTVVAHRGRLSTTWRAGITILPSQWKR
jgi:hypothetical protein